MRWELSDDFSVTSLMRLLWIMKWLLGLMFFVTCDIGLVVSCVVNLLLVWGDVALNPGPANFRVLFALWLSSPISVLYCLTVVTCGHIVLVVRLVKHCSYHQLEDFLWICPSCLTACMPFHDCSILSYTEDFDCSNLSFHEDFNVSINSPTSTHSFLHLAHLNCRSLLCKLDEVLSFCDVNAVNVMTFLKRG